MDSPGGDEARAKAARDKLDGQPLTLSKSYINNFDGDYQYVDIANDKPHWKSESGMHLYWGPRQMWLLRSRFTPDNPTASAFCDEEDLFMGDNDFQWSTTTSWVPSVLRVDPGPPEEELSPCSLRFAQCLVSKFDGDYELVGQANGRPHWSCDDGTAGGLHLYWGPQGLWLLRSVFDPASKSCSAYCSCSDTPAGSNLWHWMRGGDWHPQELAIEVGPGGDGETAYQAIDTAARAALPDGWTEDQDEKGETYFVNTHNGNTQWERPTLPADREEASDSDDDEIVDDEDEDDEIVDDDGEIVDDDGEVADEDYEDDGEIPEGWETGVSTTTGETYYINTLNDERTWDKPTQTAAEVVAAAAESGLPPGWKCKVSGSTGETYFFNTETGETQWDRPMTKDSDPLGEIFEHADMGKKGFLDKEDVNALIRAMGYEVRDEYVDGVLQLYGEDSDGRSGIHFGPNFKLLWEHLGGKPDGSMSTIGGADGEGGGPGDIDGEKLEKRELPSGWETAVSNETSEVYYVNQRTGESQFTFPEEEAEETDLPAGWEQIESRTTGKVTYLNTLTDEQTEERPTEPAVGMDGEVADDGGGDAPPVLGAPAIDGDLDAPGIGGGMLPPRDLPQGWETARSKNTGKVYYINRWSRESQYEFPAMDALPAGWTAALSTTTGEKYFVNSVSGETQFEFPEAPAEGMEEVGLTSPGVSGPHRTVSKDKPLPPGWDTATSRSTNQKFYVNVVTGESQTEFPTAPALPDGWDMATSQQSGRVYYLNSKTGEISYELPSMPARTREDEIADVSPPSLVWHCWRPRALHTLPYASLSQATLEVSTRIILSTCGHD
jgi:uncharacterized protein YbdZ (MbtH family)